MTAHTDGPWRIDRDPYNGGAPVIVADRTTGWSFGGITRDQFRDGSGGPVLIVASPGGSIRKIPLDARKLAEIIEQAARQLRVELREGARLPVGGGERVEAKR